MAWKRRLCSALVAVFSAGWLFPMGWGVVIYLDFWHLEVLPRLDGKQTGHSFPFLDFSKDCFAWGMGWLAAVVAFWAYVGFSALPRGRESRG